MKISTLVKGLLFSASIIASVTVYYYANHNVKQPVGLTKIQLKNLSALTNSEGGSGGIEDLNPSEGNPTTREECMQKGGNWNMATVAKNSGFENVICEISGEITIFGITLKGSYKRGEHYPIPWCFYTCEPSTENCCIKQGLYSGETKLG